MPQKKWCNKCSDRHFPPTGKKCNKTSEEISFNQSVHDTDVFSSTSDQDVQTPPKSQKKGMVKNKKKAAKTTQEGQQAEIQTRILEQLQKVNDRLDAMEDKVEEVAQSHPKDNTKLSTKYLSSKVSHVSSETSDESDESDSDSSVPDIETLRKSEQLQKQVDSRLRQLKKASQKTGKHDSEKFKSKRGGGLEILVKNKVAWPHESILSGANRTRVTYDQLNITQWVQGFCRNIMDERDEKTRFQMVRYMSELMEDATDFTWQGAKAAHAVLLCEFERGTVSWRDTNRIERIRRAHAQKHHNTSTKYGLKAEFAKKPWFCRFYQNGTCQYQKDHEYNGKLQKHICAFCLSQGKTLGHPEKDCTAKRQAKNE